MTHSWQGQEDLALVMPQPVEQAAIPHPLVCLRHRTFLQSHFGDVQEDEHEHGMSAWPESVGASSLPLRFPGMTMFR